MTTMEAILIISAVLIALQAVISVITMKRMRKQIEAIEATSKTRQAEARESIRMLNISLGRIEMELHYLKNPEKE